MEKIGFRQAMVVMYAFCERVQQGLMAIYLTKQSKILKYDW